MKTLTINIYNVKEKVYRCKKCKIDSLKYPKCTDCGSETIENVERILPKIMDEVIFLGDGKYDLVTYDGGFFPAWVEEWGVIDIASI